MGGAAPLDLVRLALEVVVPVDEAGPAKLGYAPRPASMFRVVSSSSAALTTAMLPVFLVGALTDELHQDLGLSETEVGAAVTILFLVAATAATPAGRVADRVGAKWALRVGVALAACVTAGVGAWADGFWQLAIPLASVGLAIGLVDTGSARAFSDELTPEQQGRAFGLKEASVPGAALLAGLAVPSLAGPYGWRWAFMAIVLIAALVLASTAGIGRARAPTGSRAPRGARPPGSPAAISRATMRLAAGVGVGAGAATAAAAFMVPALSARGIAPSTAGLILATASIASISMRVAAGLWADRPTATPLYAVVLLCTLGAAAAAALALPLPLPGTLVAAAVLLGAGWGWTGLAFLTVVRANPRSPAAAAGVVLSGLAFGGALGPIAFGALAARASYASAWIATAVALGIAAITALTGRKDFRGSASGPRP